MPTPPRTLTHDGLMLTITEWSTRTGIPVETIRCRLDRLEWSPDRAVTVPADRRFRKGGRPESGTPRPCPPARLHRPSGQCRVRWRLAGREYTRWLGVGIARGVGSIRTIRGRMGEWRHKAGRAR